MKNTLTPDELHRYSRHLALPDFSIEEQLKLKNARVLVIGAGGLGSPILLYLAAAGVGTIGIVEGDEVSTSNLQRQILFKTKETGRKKIEVAKERMEELNPNICIVPHPVYLSRENALKLIKQYDIVVDGSDNFETRYLVNDACVICKKPLVYGAVFRFEGQVAVLNAEMSDGGRGPNYRNIFPEPPAPDSIPNCAEGGVLGVLPGVIGSLQAAETIKHITGIGKILSGKLFIFDLHSFSSQIVDFSDMPPYEVKELKDFKTECNIFKTYSTMKEIDVQELKRMRDNNEDFQLVDVREPYEYDIANINGDLIPLNEIPDAEDRISKDKKVIIHCRTGGRSSQAVKILEQRFGYENLYNLKGGITAWSDEIDPEVEKY